METNLNCEATQVSEPTIPSELYCIDCEKMVHVERFETGIGHAETTVTDGGLVIEFCFFDGGYAFTPPPVEDNPDWAAQDVSEEEKEQAELEEAGFWLEGK